MTRIKIEVGDRTVSVDRRDVLAWAGVDPPRAERTAVAEARARAYVTANPRPEPDAQGAVNVPARQRMALLRRLAAGPATRPELLAAMRDAAGYVGGDDWRNRLDELRGRGQRGGGHTPLPIAHDEETDTYRLTESLPALGSRERLALGRVKGALRSVGGLVELGRALLDGMLPDVAPAPLLGAAVEYPSESVLTELDAAMQDQTVVRLRYRPQHRPVTVYDAVLPRTYLPGDTAVRAYVANLTDGGERVGGFQIALDRLADLEPRPDITPAPSATEDPAEPLVLWVTEPLRDVLTSRPLFELTTEPSPLEDAPGCHELRGSFNPELSWEVLRVLLAWTGSVRVVAPDWLAAAYARRCLEGLLAQISDPEPGLPSYPSPAAHRAGERIAALEEMAGAFQQALDGLVPADEGEPAGPPDDGRARPVRPPRGFA